MKTETQVGLFILVAIGIFFYLSISIGALRLDGPSYYTYKAYVEGSGGLAVNAFVKIAGVTVGWVDNIVLTENGIVEISLRVKKDYTLFKNSFITISQDGLIGSRTIEIDYGDSSAGVLHPGSTLAIPGKSTTSVNDILETAKEITESIQDVVSSFQGVFATPEAEKKLSSILNSVHKTGVKLQSFSETLDDVTQKKVVSIADNLDKVGQDIRDILKSSKNKVEDFVDNVSKASVDLKSSSKNIDKTFSNTEEISGKIARGEGTLGKLVNEDDLYRDVKDAVEDVKNIVGKVGNLSLQVDMNSATFYDKSNNRGVAELRLATQPDYFYALQLSSDRRGRAERVNEYGSFFDEQGNKLDLMSPSFSDYQKARVASKVERIRIVPGGMSFGAQFCKKFNDLTLRLGLFENTIGFQAEYDFAPKSKYFRILKTSVEAFDFNGFNRVEVETRPHVRWTNKVSFGMKNIYTVFGMDDLFSSNNGSFFVGFGITFEDDDLKYMLTMLPVGKMV